MVLVKRSVQRNHWDDQFQCHQHCLQRCIRVSRHFQPNQTKRATMKGNQCWVSDCLSNLVSPKHVVGLHQHILQSLDPDLECGCRLCRPVLETERDQNYGVLVHCRWLRGFQTLLCVLSRSQRQHAVAAPWATLDATTGMNRTCGVREPCEPLRRTLGVNTTERWQDKVRVTAACLPTLTFWQVSGERPTKRLPEQGQGSIEHTHASCMMLEQSESWRHRGPRMRMILQEMRGVCQV